MTISSQVRTAGPFSCNGTTTVFPFAFKVFTASDVSVIFRDTASGAEVPLVLNIDYTVSLNANQNANPGGAISTIGPAFETGATLTLTSKLQYLQPTDLTNQGAFYPKVITDALDRLTIFAQQILGIANRALKFPISDGNLDGTLPGKDQRKGRVLVFDETTGLPIAGPSIGDVIPNDYIGEELPVSPFNGMRWYKPSEATTFVYYVDGDSGQWVQESVASADSTFELQLAAVDSTKLVGGVQARQLRLVDGIKNLIAETNIAMDVKGFYVGSNIGGGQFYYDPTRNKSAHNGGTIIAPEAITGWDGTQAGLATLLNWTGSGVGCFVRASKIAKPQYFGAICDGIADDTVAMRSLFKSGLFIVGNPTDTYRITTSVVTTNVSVNAEFNGALFLYDNVIFDDHRCLAFVADMSDETTISAINYYAEVINGRLGLQVTVADASAYAVGDFIKIVSDDLINLSSPNEWLGQGFEIVKITGNNIFTSKITDLRFNTNPRLAKYRKNVKCNLRGLKFTHSNPNLENNYKVMLTVSGMVYPEINDILSFDNANTAVMIVNCYGASGDNIKARNLKGDTTLSQIGYTLVDEGSSESKWGLLYGERVRHVYTTGAESFPIGTKDVKNYGGAVNCVVDHVWGEGCHSFAADTHPDGYNTLINRVTCYSSSRERGERTGALQFRGWKEHCQEVMHIGRDYAVWLNSNWHDCTIGNVVTKGGRLLMANSSGNPYGNQTLQVNSMTHYVSLKEPISIQAIDTNLNCGDVKIIFKNDIEFLPFLSVFNLAGGANNFANIGKVFVDMSQIPNGKLGGYLPVQLQSNFGKITIEHWEQIQSQFSDISLGVSGFIGGLGSERSFSYLEIGKHTIKANASVANIFIQYYEALISNTSPIYIGEYEFIGTDRDYSDHIYHSLFVNNGFLNHAKRYTPSNSRPYINLLGNLKKTIQCTVSGGATTQIQPPSYQNQLWEISNSLTSSHAATITYSSGLTAVIPVGESITLRGKSDLTWERIK